jgi:aromatic ring-cleaving dioxygenase
VSNFEATPGSEPMDPSVIKEYHAHVYFCSSQEAQRAAWLRDQVAQRFPFARIGRWHTGPVGPHPQPMYQLVFSAEHMPQILPWLMCNRRGLSILFHPEGEDVYADHAHHAAWLGAPLPLRLERLPLASR